MRPRTVTRNSAVQRTSSSLQRKILTQFSLKLGKGEVRNTVKSQCHFSSIKQTSVSEREDSSHKTSTIAASERIALIRSLSNATHEEKNGEAKYVSKTSMPRKNLYSRMFEHRRLRRIYKRPIENYLSANKFSVLDIQRAIHRFLLTFVFRYIHTYNTSIESSPFH